MLSSSVMRWAEFSEPWFLRQLPVVGDTSIEPPRRKQWEFVSVVQALEERGMLTPGRFGIGFGVGREALPQIFAERGCFVMSSDYEDGEWGRVIAQLLANPDAAANAKYAWRSVYRTIDMNHIPADLHGLADFVWSVSSLEHCGNEQLGLDFIANSVKCLKPGGVAVHTTEFNVSGRRTARAGTSCVLFGADVIETLAERVKELGATMLPRNYDHGNHPLDLQINEPPCDKPPWLKLRILGDAANGDIATCIRLIIQRDT